ncbi:DUF2997 domain-containing protein [Coleofasciculus sp. FACHB-1120]|nr:DUF2997 domain-containing protein [Coleofasciculus sp. FACHB-1120]MBD2743788.1 DUF2997 domain-containing protein [Coleofasciculus sp. FACHB-1120]
MDKDGKNTKTVVDASGSSCTSTTSDIEKALGAGQTYLISKNKSMDIIFEN